MTGESAAELIERFRRLRAVVLGDAMLDGYLEGSTGRFSPEAPVPVVSLGGHEEVPGGAANTAMTAAALGASVELLSVVGADPEGERLRTLLDERGVGIDALVVAEGRRTLTKTRVLADGHMLLRLDEGSTEPVSGPPSIELRSALARRFDTADAVIVSDYGYGVLTQDVIGLLTALQSYQPRILLVDSKTLPSFARCGVTAVKPNYKQALRLLGIEEGNGPRLDALSGRRILDLTGSQLAAVTMASEGAMVFERNRPPFRTYARASPNVRASGAGDTFGACLALALAAGADTPAAAELASAAASVVVEKERTASCSGEELWARVAGESKYEPDPGRLAARLEPLRSSRRRVVLTNGCFDILHRGHIDHLNRAKALGDVLVVALNTDEGVRRLKGPGRPINRLEDRVEVLAALSCVDHVVPFSEPTPVEVIRTLRPDVFAKGGDYTREMLPEAPVVEDLGGVVRILPYLEDRSTTGIVERIRDAGVSVVEGS